MTGPQSARGTRDDREERDAQALAALVSTMAVNGEPHATYHGIIVEESLLESSVLRSVKVLGRERGRDWTLLRVGVAGSALEIVVERIRRNLKTENGVPFYAHFYRLGELIVVFPERIFRMTPSKDTWAPVVSYGKSVGIPLEQLDFMPCRFEDETY